MKVGGVVGVSVGRGMLARWLLVGVLRLSWATFCS
jgi:hypothetical protein